MKKNFAVIILSRVFSIPWKLLHIVKNKIKKESWQLVKKNKEVIQSQKMSEKYPKNSKFVV